MLRFTVGLGVAALLLIVMACQTSETTLPTNEVEVTTLAELLASPDRYNGREILLEGFYFQGWESNLLSESMEPTGQAEGHLWPAGQTIWVEGPIPSVVYDGLHQQDMIGPVERYGKVLIKGIFQSGEGYGHLGGFDAQIVPSDVEVSPGENASPVVPAGAPLANLTYEGAVYYGDSRGSDNPKFNEDDLELVGVSVSNRLVPGSAAGWDIYILMGGEEGYVYTFEPGQSFLNEDGRTITIKPEWVRWIATDSTPH